MASKRGTPVRNRNFTTIGSTSVRTVADRHRLGVHRNKYCWRAFRWYQHRCPWTILNPNNWGFSEFFAILDCDTHFRSELRRNHFKESFIRVHQIWVPPPVVQSSKRTVADRHRLAAHHNKHWLAFRRYQHRWPWTTLNAQNRGFSEFFAILGCDAHWEWIFAKITGDRPRQTACEIKLMLSPVSWAVARISCWLHCLWLLS